MSYFYSIGYYSYEESSYTQLVHEKKYTEKDLQKLIEEAVVAVIPEVKKERHYVSSFQDVYHEAIDYLVKKKGFRYLEFETKWDCFGWASIFDKESWKGHDRDRSLQGITKAVLKAGYVKDDDDMVKTEKEWRKKSKEKKKCLTQEKK